ncbi:MAG: hypothetical protein AAFN79_04425 [Pseudomonadota bacterium]
MRSPPLAALIALAATPALAACPTSADLADGVYVDFSDGTYVRYQTIQEDVVGEATITPGGEEDFFSGRYRGVFLMIDAGLKDNRPDRESLISFQPAKGEPDWPIVSPTMNWSGTVITQNAEGGFINRFEMSAAVTGQDRVSISGCDYDVDIVKIEEVYENGDGASELHYIREIGIGYVAAAGPVGAPYEFFYVPRYIGLKPPR